MAKTGRSVAVNGELLAWARQAAGLTQSQLADLTGYSDRLIRKAESGRTVNRETIEDLATALTEAGQPISDCDLMTDLDSVLTRFRQSYALRERQLAHECQDIIGEDFRFWTTGDDELLECFGQFDGLSRFDHGLQSFLDQFERLDKARYAADPVAWNGKEAMFHTSETVRVQATDEVFTTPLSVWVRFDAGKIVEMHSMFDGVGLSKYVVRHRPPEDRPS